MVHLLHERHAARQFVVRDGRRVALGQLGEGLEQRVGVDRGLPRDDGALRGAGLHLRLGHDLGDARAPAAPRLFVRGAVAHAN